MAARHRLILAIVATDSTFEKVVVRGEAAWSGRCIHCNARLLVALDGAALGDVTIEHIVPRHHGGSDARTNLALACSRCNSEKGRRHDHTPEKDPRRLELVARLQEKRLGRYRDPVDGGCE